ncbi:hypothetical protein MHBO_002185 [Bonamia ostreae]|uniref:Rab GDP dissociation inhibitor n=1 Tax=Bonamia ostreae TaxID=126728 RepID=A0ABV2AM45_9EUKA
MDEKYDIIILGTGLKECILSGLLSADGKKVLHLDKNDYYGGDSASLNIEELYNRYKQNETPKSELIENNKKYIIDLCPKFLMACGNLVKTLVHTKVTRYLDFKTVEGSYVFKDGSLFKMPATPTEALSSSLMGFFQKRKLRNFLNFADSVKEEDPKSQKDLKSTMRETFEHFGLDENSIVSIGHALALYKDDSYLDDPKERFPFLEAIKLYAYSVQRYGVSPFIYPI